MLGRLVVVWDRIKGQCGLYADYFKPNTVFHEGSHLFLCIVEDAKAYDSYFITRRRIVEDNYRSLLYAEMHGFSKDADIWYNRRGRPDEREHIH